LEFTRQMAISCDCFLRWVDYSNPTYQYPSQQSLKNGYNKAST
jgi:hypothetical protein